MAILDNRVRIQTKGRNFHGLWCIFVTLGLFILINIITKNHAIRTSILEFDGTLARATRPVSDFITYAIRLGGNIFRISSLHEENLRLRSEIDTLTSLRISMANTLELVHSTNKALAEELNLVEHTTRTGMRARLIFTSNGEYECNAILELGHGDGIHQDQVVISAHGIVGRVIEVGENFSRVMLATDPQSRISVQTIDGKFRGIAAGDGEQSLRITHFAQDNIPKEGEMLITSGDGKSYPYGLPVARISTSSTNFVSALSFYDNNNTEFVTLLK